MRSIFLNSVAALALISCTRENPEDPGQDFTMGQGVFITNEGPFQNGTGSLSYFDVNANEVHNQVFQKVNGRPLGNIVHSVHRGLGSLFVVVNNAGVVEVMSDVTGSSRGTLTGFTSPRYVQVISETEIAVSDWGSQSVHFVNPFVGTVYAEVPMGNGPERMLYSNGKLYVVNSGGFGTDSTVFVVDVASHSVVDTLFAGQNPNSLALDAYGDLWVLSAGIIDWSTPQNSTSGRLHQLDTATGQVLASFDFNDNTIHPMGLQVNAAGTELYYLSDLYTGAPYSMSVSAGTLPATPLVSRSFYAMGYDPHRDELYFADPIDFSSLGKVFRFDLSSQSIVDSIRTGVIPGNFAFK